MTHYRNLDEPMGKDAFTLLEPVEYLASYAWREDAKCFEISATRHMKDLTGWTVIPGLLTHKAMSEFAREHLRQRKAAKSDP